MEIDDLRELKARVARESSRLKDATEEQKRHEEKTRVRGCTRRIETLQASLSEAQEQAATDALTGIANRGRFDETIAPLARGRRGVGRAVRPRHRRHRRFKAINDTHGHPVGDRVILCTAQWLQSSVRDADFVARYGGEEFAVLFSRATAAEAERGSTRVLQELASRPFTYDGPDGPRTVSFTLSAGMAESAPATPSSAREAGGRGAVSGQEARAEPRGRAATRAGSPRSSASPSRRPRA